MNVLLGLFAYFILYGAAAAFVEIKMSRQLVRSPKYIYDNIRVNWFGAWLLFIMLCIASPLEATIKFFMWACTVGRDEEG